MGACLSSPYLAPLTLPVRHVVRAFTSNLSRDQRLAFSNELPRPHCSGINFVVWRRSAMYIICALQLLSIIFAIADGAAVDGVADRMAQLLPASNTAAFEASCTASCAASGVLNSQNLTSICSPVCQNATAMLVQAPASCSDPATAANAIDTLHVAVDALHVVSFTLSMLLVAGASCMWREHGPSGTALAFAYALRLLVPFVAILLPWFNFLSIDCPQFRAYAAALLATPLMCVVMGLLPGLVRASRLVNSVVPASFVPLLFMRVGPIIFMAFCITVGGIVYQLLGNALAAFGMIAFAVAGLVFVRLSYVLQGTKHGRAAASISAFYRLAHLGVFAVGGLLTFLCLLVAANDAVDSHGASPASLPLVPGLDFFIAFGLAYVVDLSLASLLFSDLLVGSMCVMKNRGGYLASDSNCVALVALVADQPGADDLNLDGIPPPPGIPPHVIAEISQDNPARGTAGDSNAPHTRSKRERRQSSGRGRGRSRRPSRGGATRGHSRGHSRSRGRGTPRGTRRPRSEATPAEV